MMLDVIEERKTSVLRVLTDLSGTTGGDPRRSCNELPVDDSPQPSFEELKNIQQAKKLIQKKIHPLFENHPYRCASMYGARASSSRPNIKLKDISHQRIHSAKLLQIKELRNQLTLTQHQLNEVTNENRFLKTLHKRQEVALRKYEGQEARLPQLIQSHNEEVRMLTTKMKQLRHTNQHLMEKLKSAEHQLSSLQEQHCHLVELSRNNHLGEREELANQVEELEHTVCDQNNTIQLLNRKVDLERKNYKHELGLEKNKRNQADRKLALAMQTIENLKDQIEAKEKCMNAIVPSRFVRTSQLTNTAAPTARLTHTHTQIPKTPRNQNSLSNLKNSISYNQALRRRSSTDNTGDETDITESRNGHNTSDSSRTISNTTLPKIKPQMTNRNLRNQYKLSSKRLINKESAANGTPEYSSSFASEDVSLKDARKNSESESDKLPASVTQSTINSRRNSSRSRKFSVDSGVMNRSESGKITQRTNDSRTSSSKTRRNSMSACPPTFENTEEMEQYLQQDSLAEKIKSHKSIREELRELEEKLLQGSTFLDKSKKQVSLDQDDGDSKDLIDTPRNASENGSADEGNEKFDDVNWQEIHNKMKAESKAAEDKLDEYYSSLEKSELNFEETENFIALEEEQKARLLKALQEIDKEAQGVSSGSSADETTPKTRQTLARRKSDGYRYSFSKNIDNLHKGRPVYDNVKVPVVEKMRKEEKDYLADIENGRKNKAELMKELFGSFEDKNDDFASSTMHQEDLERLVELDRALD